MLTIDQMTLEAQLRVRLCIVKACFDAKQQLGLSDDNLIDDCLEVQAAEHWLGEAMDLHWDENCKRAELQWRESHSWLDDAERSDHTNCQIERATNFVRAYISASQDREFSYDCNVNPEGVSDDRLSELEDDARNRMMATLAVLTDVQISGLLAVNKDRDHDGSLFAVTSVVNVRRWQIHQNEHGNVIATPNRTHK